MKNLFSSQRKQCNIKFTPLAILLLLFYFNPIHAQNFESSYTPGGTGGCSDAHDEIVYPNESFDRACCTGAPNGIVRVTADLPAPQDYKITNVSFDGLPAGLEVSAQVKAGVGTSTATVFQSAGETSTFQNIFQRNGSCAPCHILSVYFKFGPNAAPPNTNATATFDVNYCNGSNCNEYAFSFTVPVNLLEEPFLELDNGKFCVDESIDITIDRNNIGPQFLCTQPFTALNPPGRLMWTVSNKLIINDNNSFLFLTNSETISVGVKPQFQNQTVTGEVCVTHTPALISSADAWYIPLERKCKRIRFEDCSDFVAPTVPPVRLTNLCSESNEPTCYTFAQPCIENITVQDNDPLLVSSVLSDGRTVCLRSNHPCIARVTRQVQVRFEDACGNITNRTWTVKINQGLLCCQDEENPRIHSGDNEDDLSNRSAVPENGVDHSYETNQISAFPNPFQNELTVDLSNISGEFTGIKLMDVTGSTKISEDVKLDANQHIFNLRNLKAGIYIIVLQRKNLRPVKLKVVKTTL